jgi:trehalose utilization protein
MTMKVKEKVKSNLYEGSGWIIPHNTEMSENARRERLLIISCRLPER